MQKFLEPKSALTPDENRVVALKYRSPRIGEMHEEELSLFGKALLLKIHVITGWTIPNSSELLNILIDQFQKHLFEKFPELNVDEIEFAFRKDGTTTKDWGKAFNLNLVDQVLLPYLGERATISEVEEKLTHKPEQKIYTQEELDNSAREDAECQYQRFLRGLELFGLGMNKPILVRDGFISEGDDVMEFFKRRAKNKIFNLYVREGKA